MYKIAKNLSPFTLGLVFCCSQATLLPAAHAASLNPTFSGELTLSSVPNVVDQNVLGATPASNTTTLPSGVANEDCLLKPSLKPSPKRSGITPVPKKSGDMSLNYQSNEIASADISGSEATPKMMKGGTRATSANLIAQATADDCCGIGGAATCEVGGVPTGGAALGGISPLLGLLGLIPAAAVPIALGGGDNNDSGSGDPGPVPGDPVPGLGDPVPGGPGDPVPGGPGPVPGDPGTPPPPAGVPEPSSTGVIVAAFGMMGLWLSRRHRSGRKGKDVGFE